MKTTIEDIKNFIGRSRTIETLQSINSLINERVKELKVQEVKIGDMIKIKFPLNHQLSKYNDEWKKVKGMRDGNYIIRLGKIDYHISKETIENKITYKEYLNMMRKASKTK